MTEEQIAEYAEELKKEYNLEGYFLRKIVRNEAGRTKPAMLYDLDYDIQLNAAIDVIKKGDFDKLMEETKTLKDQLEEDQKAKEE